MKNLYSANIPLFVVATVGASLSIIIGLIWDISWHMSIGRDGFFSPPHLAILMQGMVHGTGNQKEAHPVYSVVTLSYVSPPLATIESGYK